MARPYKLYALAEQMASIEALGQLQGAENLEDDVALCAQQTIEPVFRQFLPKGEQILEAGCGRGRWVLYLRRLGYDVVGIDVAEGDLAAAKLHDPSLPVSRADVLRTGFPDGHFGAVISLGVVEHFEEGPQAALAEVQRILRPRGLFLVAVPTENLPRLLLVHRIKDLKGFIHRSRGRELAFSEYRYSRRQFASILREAGFEILESHPDELRPPKNAGLYSDIGLLQRPGRLWELNLAGRALNAALRAISPWLYTSGTLWVCRR